MEYILTTGMANPQYKVY